MTFENINAIIETHFIENIIKVGDKVIDFTLKNALGKCSNLQAIIK